MSRRTLDSSMTRPAMPAPQPLLYTPRLITLPGKDRLKLWMDNEKKGCKLMVTTFCLLAEGGWYEWIKQGVLSIETERLQF